MDVLNVVILSGFTRPAEIELVCLAACNFCRENSADYSLAVKVKNIHLVLQPTQEEEHEASLSPPSSAGAGGNIHDSISNAVNMMGAAAKPSSRPLHPKRNRRITPHRQVSRLSYHVDLPLSQVVWPGGLRALRFSWPFDHPLDRPLPDSLVSLELGGSFNHHVEKLAWPPRLTFLRFGDRFNRQVELAAWPETLRQLTFGSSFDQPIESVDWPPALEFLWLGDGFNHPVRDVRWAGMTKLSTLEFGTAFRCEVDGVVWPPGLLVLKFGACFDPLLDARQFPKSLRLLCLPDVYGMFDELEPNRLPKGCRVRIDRIGTFDLTH